MSNRSACSCIQQHGGLAGGRVYNIASVGQAERKPEMAGQLEPDQVYLQNGSSDHHLSTAHYTDSIIACTMVFVSLESELPVRSCA